jgi:hypothetical protein
MSALRLALAALAVAFVSACSAPYGATGGTGPGSQPGDPGGSATGGSSGSPGGSGHASSASDAGRPDTGGSNAAGVDSGGPNNGSADSGALSHGGDDSGGPSQGGADGGDPDSGTPSSAPTWTQIFTQYLAGTTSGSGGTIGHCASCHGQASSASATYAFLQSYNQVGSLGQTPGSIFTWMGGTMPVGGTTSDPQAALDVQAWAAAGALDN